MNLHSVDFIPEIIYLNGAYVTNLDKCADVSTH